MSRNTVETTLYSLSNQAPLPDRRTGQRYLSLLRVGALVVDGRRELCLIRNISAGGMMIRPYSPIAVGAVLSVELKQGAMVSGTVQWVENNMVGVVFDQMVDVVALLSPSNSGSQPRMPRIEIECTAYVREEADIHRTRSLNISQGGMCVRTGAELGMAAQVTVSLSGLRPIRGTVKWKDDDVYGITFHTVIPVGELMRFLREKQGEQAKVA